MGHLEGNALFVSVTALTALGFMQIGWDNGLMGSLVNAPAFQKTFNNPSPVMLGLIVSILEIGAFFGSIATAIYGEQLGRRKTILVAIIVMAIGSLLQATAYTRAHLIVARVVAGIGLGMSNSAVPVMQAEYSPKSQRGLFVCMQLSTLNFGIFLVYWISYGFSFHTASYAWRIPCILQWAMLIVMFGLAWIVDETPRWLVAHGHQDKALDVLRRLHSKKESEAEVVEIHSHIMDAAAVEASIGTGTWKDLLKNDAIQSQKRFIIACAIQIFQQLGGINAIIYYSSTLFQISIGFDGHTSALMAGALQTWFFLASFIPWFLIDRIGRRPLLLSMIFVMGVVMAVQAGLINQVQNTTSIAHSAGIAAAAMLFIYQGAFTIGFQATVWVYPSEILPLRLRQRGSSISTAYNWIINYMIVQITPPAIANIGWKTYIIFAVLNFSFLPIIYLYFPETKGLALEEVDRLFAKDSAIVDELKGHHHSKSAPQYAEHAVTDIEKAERP